MSAIAILVAWNAARARPNCRRARACRTASSRAREASPQAAAAAPGRKSVSTDSTAAAPAPIFPRRAPGAPSSRRSATGSAAVVSKGRQVRSDASPSTRKSESPCVPVVPASLRARTITSRVRAAAVTHVFSPSRRHRPLSETAVVRIPPTSAPASGSATASAPSDVPAARAGSQRARCPSLPPAARRWAAWPWAAKTDSAARE